MLIYLQNSKEFKLERKNGKLYLSKAEPDIEQYVFIGVYADFTKVLEELALYADEQEAISMRETLNLISSALGDMQNAINVEKFD
jgi:hypothetical protein